MDSEAFDFRNIAIIGQGLMGSSMGLAIKTSSIGEKVTIRSYDPHPQPISGILISDTLQEAVRNADLILLAAPIGTYAEIIRNLRQCRPADTAILMDLGSVKGQMRGLMDGVKTKNGSLNWMGGHPMCGSDQCGASYANGRLFHGAVFFITEGSATETQRLQIERLIKGLGALPVLIDPHVHDKTVAMTSHLPHLQAVMLMLAVEEVIALGNISIEPFIAGGFRDVTRIAGGHERIWRDIVMANKASIMEAIEAYEIQLSKMKILISNSDPSTLEGVLRRARQLRQAIIPKI